MNLSDRISRSLPYDTILNLLPINPFARTSYRHKSLNCS